MAPFCVFRGGDADRSEALVTMQRGRMPVAAPACAALPAHVDAPEALDALPPDRPLLVDFDHTLLAANSTELFLAQARPRLLVALLLWVVDALEPWRFLPARRDRLRAWRDVLRVRLVALVDPGVWRRWRREGARRAEALLDADLLTLAARREAHVVTLGFEPIVAPILARTGLAGRLVAMPLAGGPRARDAGKLARTRAAIDAATLARATVVTDDVAADADLIDAAAGVTVWPAAGDAAPAFADAYLPMRYVSRVKRPGLGQVRRIYLGEDALTLCIASALAAGAGWETAPVVVLATLAFASVYDIGYAENDRLGRLREADPHTPEGWDRWPAEEIARGAWLGALVFGAPAVGLVTLTEGSFWPTALAFAALLIAARAVFALFNRTPVAWRLGPFFALQGLKSFGIALAFGLPLTSAGVALLAALAVGRAVPYAIYRAGGPRWRTPDQLIRMGLFLAFLAAAVLFEGPAALDLSAAAGLAWSLDLSAVAGLAWCLLKARREIRLAPALRRLLPGARRDFA